MTVLVFCFVLVQHFHQLVVLERARVFLRSSGGLPNQHASRRGVPGLLHKGRVADWAWASQGEDFSLGGRVSRVHKASRAVDDLALRMLREHLSSLVGWPLPPLVRLCEVFGFRVEGSGFRGGSLLWADDGG